MKVLNTVRVALRLLTKRDRRVLLLVVVAQGLLGLMDMVGIALIGLVVGVAASVAIGTKPGILMAVTSRLGIEVDDPVRLVTLLAATAAVLLMAKSILSFWVTRRAFRFLANRQAMVAGRLSARLLSRPLLYVHGRSSQESAFALTTGVASATLGIIGQGVVIASEFALLLVLAVGLLVVSPWLTVFTLLYFVGTGLLIHRRVAQRAERLGLTATEADIASFSILQEILRSYREVFVGGRRSIYVRKFQEQRWTAASVQADLFITTQVPKYAFDVALIIGGGLLVASQAVFSSLAAGLAVIAIFYVAASRIMPSLLRMQGAIIDMKHARGSAKITFELAKELGDDPCIGFGGVEAFDFDVEAICRGIREGHSGFEPSVEVEDVSLSYPASHAPALTSVALRVSPGEKVALVGATGAGKSTLADLILGVIDPDTGSVRIGGTSPREAVTRWPGAIGYVPQDIVITSGTIRDNVALGLPKDAVCDEQVWEALERAHIADFLRSNRDGLDTIVGEHGMKLSGGQRQRLGLARALYTRPKLLVLDEATSALDSETEYLVNGALVALGSEVTQIVIAHRFSTIRQSSRIVYLEQGRLIANGSFEQVRAASAAFDRQAALSGL